MNSVTLLYDIFYIGRARARQPLPEPDSTIAYARSRWRDEYLIPIGGEWFMGTRDEAESRVGAGVKRSTELSVRERNTHLRRINVAKF